MTTETNPAAAPPPAPTSNRDAVIAELESEAPAAAPAEAPKPEGAPAEPPKAEAKPAEPAKKEEPAKPETFAAQFQRLATEKAQIQKEKQAVLEERKAYAAVTEAMRKGDKLALIQALGYDPKEFVSDLRVSAPEAESPKAGKQPLPEVEELRAEIAELKQARVEQMRSSTLESLRSTVRKSEAEFPLVTRLGEEETVLRELERYYQQNQSLPADTFEESVALAAKLVEERLQAQAKRWQSALTPAQASANVGTQAPGEASRPSVSGTLTNSLSSPAGTAPKPKTKEELIEELSETL